MWSFLWLFPYRYRGILATDAAYVIAMLGSVEGAENRNYIKALLDCISTNTTQTENKQ